MSSLVLKEIDFNGAKLAATELDGKIYVGVKWVCNGIGLSEGQIKNERLKIQNDVLLSKGCKKIKLHTKGGVQYIVCINLNYLPIWLCKINQKLLNDFQYKNAMELINFCLSEDFEKLKIKNITYYSESCLRDEIYDCGRFDDIKIIGREVIYPFGRIDLLGVDKDDNKICIELKRYKEFNDTKEQLLKYKNSNEFKEIVYCAYEINEDFKLWCSLNDIKCYVYKRELKLEKIF